MAHKYRQQAGPALPPVEAAIEMPAAAPVAEPAPAQSVPAAEMPAMAEEFSIEVQAPVAEAPIAEVPVAEAPVAQEIDLSGEWESMTTTEAPTPPPAAPESMPVEAAPVEAAPEGPSLVDQIEEVKFYLSQSMFDEARAGLEKCEAISPGGPGLAELRALLEAGVAAADTQKIEAVPEPPVEAPAEPVSEAAGEASVQALVFDEAAIGGAAVVEPPTPPAEEPAVQEAAPPPAPVPAPAPSGDVLSDFVLDLEESLGEDFAIGGAKGKPAPKPAAVPLPPPPPPLHPATPAAVAQQPAPMPPPTPAPVAAPAMAAAAAAPAPVAVIAPTATLDHPETKSVLSDMFEEFKEDVEETQGEPEDPDTHYNLGVAFKEMGLMDEAIGELQKVCQAIDRGHPFTQVMQAYTWLAHCFIEKGVPQAAIKWYEKALKAPGADEDSRLAVYYELGNAHEAAGNKKAALDSFMEVYGANIDYRDVAERIKALKS